MYSKRVFQLVGGLGFINTGSSSKNSSAINTDPGLISSSVIIVVTNGSSALRAVPHYFEFDQRHLTIQHSALSFTTCLIQFRHIARTNRRRDALVLSGVRPES